MARKKKRSKKELNKLMREYGIKADISHNSRISLPCDLENLIGRLQSLRKEFPEVKKIEVSTSGYNGDLFVSFKHQRSNVEIEKAIEAAEKKEMAEKREKVQAMKNKMKAYEEKFKDRRPF